MRHESVLFCEALFAANRDVMTLDEDFAMPRGYDTGSRKRSRAVGEYLSRLGGLGIATQKAIHLGQLDRRPVWFFQSPIEAVSQMFLPCDSRTL